MLATVSAQRQVARIGRVAVVGGGLAGLACARTLAASQVDVTVFDKGRAVGGRCSSRRQPPAGFDLGAQYFTVQDRRFGRWVCAWQVAGVCAPWLGRIVAIDPGGGRRPQPVEPIERHVGTPDMGALAAELATRLTVNSSQRVDQIVRRDGQLHLRGTIGAAGQTLGPGPGPAAAVGLGAFDRVLVCLPADQAALLLDPICPALAASARALPLDPCWAVGLVVSADAGGLAALDFDGAFIGRPGGPTGSPLSWIGRDSSKPGRPPGERWVLHASSTWSAAALDWPGEVVTEALAGELSRLLALPPLAPLFTVAQRWRYARAAQPVDDGALLDISGQLGLGGDWLAGGRVEGACLSGIALAERILALSSG